VSGDGGVVKKTLVSTKEWKVCALQHCFLGRLSPIAMRYAWCMQLVQGVVTDGATICAEIPVLCLRCRSRTPARR